MKALLFAMAVIASTLTSASAHFVFVVPQSDGTVKAVFSETLESDDAVTVEKIAGLTLTLRDAAGKDSKLKLTAAEHDLSGKLGDVKPRMSFGSVPYGVMQRGESKPFLLQYHAKTLWPGCDAKNATLGKDSDLEIVPTVADGKTTLSVLSHGKPVAKAEINLVNAEGEKQKVTTDEQGRTKPLPLTGRYGAWVRLIETRSGETADQKKYEEVRHYATLVADAPAK